MKTKTITPDMSPEEKRFYAERSMPALYKDTRAIIPLMLTLPIFSISRASGEAVNSVWTRKGFGFVRYTGPQLSQSHLTVLLGLAHMRQGDVVDNVITFRPSNFCAFIGWSDNARNKKRLEEILDDLFAAKMKIWGKNEVEEYAARVSIVSEWKPACEATAEWSVYLSHTVLRLFPAKGMTYLTASKRQQLREGLATFLFGYINANNCKVAFSYEELHAASGSTGVLGADFSKEIRRQLDSFKEAGIIVNYEQQKGKLRVWNKRSSRKQ